MLKPACAKHEPLATRLSPCGRTLRTLPSAVRRPVAGLSPIPSPHARLEPCSRASAALSLHPDRLVGLSTPRRAEATEIFKVLSAAYDVASEKAKATLDA